MSPQLPPTATVSTAEIESLAQAEQLLVAMDFDGTMAPFTSDPMASRPEPGALEALTELAGLAGTTVMIVSGRNLKQLREVTGLHKGVDTPIRLVGSHGAEPAEEELKPLTDKQHKLYAQLESAAEAAATLHAGLWVERKPLSVGLHSRKVSNKDVADQANASFLSTAHTLDDVKVTQGKSVVEVAVDSTSKGDYVNAFRTQHNIPTVVFAGDDTTDESVMAVLDVARGDVSIKVGAGKSKAARRLANTVAVRDFLQALATARKNAAARKNA